MDTEKYLVKSEICSVEAAFSESETVFYFTHLKNKNNKIELVYTNSSDTLNIPEKFIKSKIPILLIANGKGIILKKISLSENTDQDFDALIRTHLPNINTVDFFVQLFKTSDNSAYIALCRKEQLNYLLQELKNKKVEVANIFIGAASVVGLEPLWSNFNALSTTFHKVELTNNSLDSIVTENNDNVIIKIDALNFTSAHTLGFAAGLSYLMQQNIYETDSPEILTLQTKHIEKNKYKVLMTSVVVIAFILAVTNVFFYSTYFDKNNKLETELSVYQGKYEQINQLLSDYQQKKGLIENAGILNKNKLSEYSDRIAATIPSEVVLNELYFNPKNEDEESEDSLVTFYNKKLVLKGNCNKSIIINEWINVLKMQKFIKEVSLEKFSYNNEGILPNFEIKIMTE